MDRRVLCRTVWFCVVGLAVALAVTLGALMAPHYRVYAVRTGSMLPSIQPKSAVVVRRGIFEIGDVITFRTKSGLVTHRLIAVNANGTLRTKGDANETPDPGSLSPNQVVGQVIAAPRMVGYWLVYLSTPAGLASVLALLLSLWLIASLTDDLITAPAEAASDVEWAQ